MDESPDNFYNFYDHDIMSDSSDDNYLFNKQAKTAKKASETKQTNDNNENEKDEHLSAQTLSSYFTLYIATHCLGILYEISHNFLSTSY